MVRHHRKESELEKRRVKHHDYEHEKHEEHRKPDVRHKKREEHRKHDPKPHHDERKREEHHEHERHIYRKSKMLNDEFYAGMEPRRRQELHDAGMIEEDHNEIANLPQHVMIKPYPKSYHNIPEGLDDTIDGIDYQIEYDNSQKDKELYPKKV